MNAVDQVCSIPTLAWLPITTAVVALLIAAASGVWRAYVHFLQQRQATWLRFHELCGILNNTQGKLGIWQQYAAALELKHMKVHETAKKAVALSAINQWENSGNIMLIDQLQSIVNE